jgi:hypothetical protein
MRFSGVVSADTEQVVEFFPDRERAETFVAKVEEDEPETAVGLRVEPVEVG